MPGKIPFLYEKSTDVDGKTEWKLNPKCQWVVDGEGKASCRFYGLTVKHLNGVFTKEYRIPCDSKEPDGFEFECLLGPPCEGWKCGFVPMGDHWIDQMIHELPVVDGKAVENATYQLVGPSLSYDIGPGRVFIKDQYRAFGGYFNSFKLIKHGSVGFKKDPPRDVDGLCDYNLSFTFAGIVWNHPDGRAAKVNTWEMCDNYWD